MGRRPDPQVIDPGRPDWVMLGVPGPGAHGEPGVWLYASKELTSAQLKAEVDEAAHDRWMELNMEVNYLGGLLSPPPPLIITISAVMKKFIIIQAPDYPTAFDALFKKWRPEAAQRPSLPPGRRVLEAGDG